LVRRRAECLRGRAVHLPLDDLWMDAVAAVVHRRVVDDLVDAGLRVDLERTGMDLRRVGEREITELALEIRLLELRPIDMPHVERDVEGGRQPGGIRVED